MDSDPAAIPSSDDRHNIKVKVASTLKWTVIDKVSVQLLYAVTGIVLALKQCWCFRLSDLCLSTAVLLRLLFSARHRHAMTIPPFFGLTSLWL